ncbi:hypothetical protein EST38_g12532 [Candolleomyces aberdarensis]|uniref:Uncharacterized protein n=1 Tax=Candolleomyces aberdarensis TaxID=2316362 RepID=A0A4Q2D270_9AGAR|nr:hypothetical protein EST38_g12532 [Candolleomyces aberdarensis]
MALANRIRAFANCIPLKQATRNTWREWCEKAVVAEAVKKPINVKRLTWVLMYAVFNIPFMSP